MKIKFKKFIKNIINTISKQTFVEEVVFFIGLIIITFTNFMINLYFGLYFVGLMFILYSIFLFRVRR